MKVLIATDMYSQINGVSNSVKTLKEELTKLGHDVRILTLSLNNKSYCENNVYYISSHIISIYPNARFTLKKKDNLIDELISWHPDIVHVQTEFSARVLADKIISKVKSPLVMTCHVVYEDYIKYFCPDKKVGLYIIKKLSRKYYNRSKALVVPSVKLKNILLSYGVKCPIEIIPTGISLDTYKQGITQLEKEKLLKSLNLNNDDKIIVNVCRLAYEKNVDELIDYMPDLIKRDDKIKLLIVGDGPYREKLEEKVNNLGLKDHIRFAGMVPFDEVYKYYYLGKIFVCASTSESQGLTYAEALAASLPLVCKKDECLDLVIEEGKNGYIFTNKEEYISGILNILNNNNLYASMKSKSLKMSNFFEKKEFGKHMETFYKKIINEVKW